MGLSVHRGSSRAPVLMEGVCRLQSFQVLHSQGEHGGLMSVWGPTTACPLLSENTHDVLIVHPLGLLAGCLPASGRRRCRREGAGLSTCLSLSGCECVCEPGGTGLASPSAGLDCQGLGCPSVRLWPSVEHLCLGAQL